MRLGLGCAGFGQEYGLPGERRVTGAAAVEAILRRARQGGIDLLDTAPVYGECERRLGAVLDGESDFRIVTKLPPRGHPQRGEPHAVEACLRRSLADLRRGQVYALLVHDSQELREPGAEALFDRLRRLRDAGLVERIGISVYDPFEVEQVCERFPVEVVQLPINVLDRRFRDGGHLAELRRRGVEIHARSVFLRGLLLRGGEPPRYFAALDAALARFHRRREDLGLDAPGACLAYLRSLPEVDLALCGVDSVAQLEAILQPPVSLDEGSFDDLGVLDERWLDPRKWVDA